jgi:hypothetical protein
MKEIKKRLVLLPRVNALERYDFERARISPAMARWPKVRRRLSPVFLYCAIQCAVDWAKREISRQ